MAAVAHIRLELFYARHVTELYLFLLEKSSEAFLKKEEIAHFLFKNINNISDKLNIVRAVETHIKPKSWDNYSNFQEIFSMQGWKTIRILLASSNLKTELEKFVDRHDRSAYWVFFDKGRV